MRIWVIVTETWRRLCRLSLSEMVLPVVVLLQALLCFCWPQQLLFLSAEQNAPHRCALRSTYTNTALRKT